MSENTNQIDLTIKSITIPDLNFHPEILLDSKIREIKKLFTLDNSKIIITGPKASGKTTHLYQFIQSNKNCCFSYFITDDFWSKRQSAFLSSLCNQMAGFLGIDSFDDQYGNNFLQVDIEKQKSIFENFSHKIIEKTKKDNTCCYFVIDGLERTFSGNPPGESIIDLLPLPCHNRGLLFLGSVDINSVSSLNFDFHRIDPHYFSYSETKNYLEDLSIPDDKLRQLQEFSGGMPGYLSLSKTLIYSGQLSLDQLLNEPSRFESLLDVQWKNIIGSTNEDEKKVFALLAFSLIPLDSTTISNIIDVKNDLIKELLLKSNIVKKVNECCFGFFPDLYKHISQEKLKNYKDLIVKKLIDYYSNNLNNQESKILLSEYYRLENNITAIEKLYTPDYLLDLSLENNSLSIVSRLLYEAVDLAYENKNLSIFNFAIATSQIHNLSHDLIGISEVKALTSLKKYDEALKLAYTSNILTTKLRLLSQIYLSMEKDGITIPRSYLDEISSLVHNLNINELDPDNLLNLSTDLFLLMPDLATDILDKANLIGINKSPIELVALLASLNSEEPEDESLLDKIKTKELHDIALVNSPWLTKLPAIEIIRKSKEASNIKSGEFLLRHWCIQNKKDKNVHLVIDEALNLLLSDPNYIITLRNLRQLSEPLINCPLNSRELLIKRFQNILLSDLFTPIQERIRIELNIIEALFEINPQESLSNLRNIYCQLIESEIDIDIYCYCLARLLITSKKLYEKDELDLIVTIKEKLTDGYISLIDTSADQLEVSKSILRAVSKVEFELALTFAEMLNTVDRRDLGIQEVLTSYIREDIGLVNIDLIKQGLSKITDNRIKEDTLLKLVLILNELDFLSNPVYIKFFTNYIDSLRNPINKCKFTAYLIANINLDPTLIEDLFQKLSFSFEKINILWMQVECGYDLVSIISKSQPKFAEEIYQFTKSIKHSSTLSNQTIGAMYYETLQLVGRVAGYLDLNNSDSKKLWDILIKAIEILPSVQLKLFLFAQIAVSRLNCGDKKTFDELINSKILPGLGTIPISEFLYSVLSDITLPIFKFSPDEAKNWIEKLPYIVQNITWFKISYRLITKSNLNDPIDGEPSTDCVDLQVINNILKILEYTTRDQEVYLICRLLCQSISTKDCQIPEIKKLDILTKIEDIIQSKLPDLLNITHPGYYILANGEIERAKRLSKKQHRAKLPKNYYNIAHEARNIKNISDKVFVLTELSVLFKEINPTLANDLIEEASNLILSITNVKDRISRLENLAESFSKLKNTSKAIEIFILAKSFAQSMVGIEKDQVLSSLIQSAYQIDKDIANQIDENLENQLSKYKLEISNKSYDLSKSPHKISLEENKYLDDEIISTASKLMLKSLINGKSISCSIDTIYKWLSMTKNMSFDKSKNVIDWALEALIEQATDSEKSQFAYRLTSGLISNCQLISLLGKNFSCFSYIPDTLLENFQGLSTNKKFFKVGQREEAKNFLSDWIRGNISSSIKICDPYFYPDQLWILRIIPSDIEIKIVTSLEIYQQKKENTKMNSSSLDKEKIKKIREDLKSEFSNGWSKISNQNPPSTFIVVHGSIFDDNKLEKFHDRYIITDKGGLSIGTSLNGFGNKEFFITILSQEDANYVSQTYINPKLRIDEHFSKMIYFELQ